MKYIKPTTNVVTVALSSVICTSAPNKNDKLGDLGQGAKGNFSDDWDEED